MEIAYTMQAAVDDRHDLFFGTHTINRNVRNALSNIAFEAKANLNIDTYVPEEPMAEGKLIEANMLKR